MPPPSASSHAAERTLEFAQQRSAALSVSNAVERIVEPAIWCRLRLVVDVVVLYLASSAAVFAAPGQDKTGNRWLAAAFPVIVLVLRAACRARSALRSRAARG